MVLYWAVPAFLSFRDLTWISKRRGADPRTALGSNAFQAVASGARLYRCKKTTTNRDMNRSFYKIIVSRSVLPLYCIIIMFVHPHVPKIVLALVLLALIHFYPYITSQNKKNVDRSVSIKGLAHAAIAAPFLILFTGAVLFAVGFCFAYIDEHLSKIIHTTILLLAIIIFWLFDIFIGLRKEKKKIVPDVAPGAATPPSKG